jgi:hypothetical protein
MDIEKIRTAIKSLPHASKLNQIDLTSWLTSVSQSDPSRLFWHLERARAVGGSEIGTLLLEAQGLTPPFGNTGIQIAREKRLQSPPTRPLPHMMRGILLEKPMIKAILKIYGGERDFHAESLVQNGTIDGMAGNCDFYWNLNQKRILVDTKVPINASDPDYIENENYKIFSYKAQLNHYDLLGESQGMSADKLVIAELDVPTELADKWVRLLKQHKENGEQLVVDQMSILLADDTPGMRINFIEVEKDLSIDLYGSQMSMREAIKTVSEAFMNHLINDTPLQKIESDKELILPNTEEELKILDSRLGNLRAIAEYCENTTEHIHAEIRSKIDINVSLGDYKGELFTLKQTDTIDMGAAIKTLSRYPIDLEELRKDPEPANSRNIDLAMAIKVLNENGLIELCMKTAHFDPVKVETALTTLGENTQSFKKSDITFRKSVKKSARERFSQLRESSNNIEEFLTVRDLNAKHEQSIEESKNLTIENDTTSHSNSLKLA